MPKYLIIITGNTLSGEPVSVTAHADHIQINNAGFVFYDMIHNLNKDFAPIQDWHPINFTDYFNLNILWQSDGFCGHLSYVKLSKGERK